MLPEGNFLYIPDKDLKNGQLYQLGDAQHEYMVNCFVVIPYSEPRLSKPEPKFYPITSSARIEGFLPVSVLPPLKIKAGIGREEYIQKVQRLKNEIQQGNIYEINFCMRFRATEVIDPLSVFRELCLVSNAPYLMLAKIGDDFILCASPELFLRKEGHTLYTKPIKGTKRRGENINEDVQLRDELFNSVKDRTENVMAVDVARNDLSIIAKKGSVAVNKLYNIETFETVHQMVSTVKCELAAGTTFGQIIEATFPMASMTGAPKRRAMQLIGETEGFERSFYSGTMGIINHGGDYTLPVLIRSIFYDRKKSVVWFGAGGAITWLSDPAEEYEECLLKASGALKALNASLEV
jgi:para-aminobenzoate synthetase component 1